MDSDTTKLENVFVQCLWVSPHCSGQPRHALYIITLPEEETKKEREKEKEDVNMDVASCAPSSADPVAASCVSTAAAEVVEQEQPEQEQQEPKEAKAKRVYTKCQHGHPRKASCYVCSKRAPRVKKEEAGVIG